MHRDLRRRLQGMLRSQGVDVYIACTPANVHYTSGFQSSFLDLSWQMTGTDMVILPSDEDLEPALIVSDYCALDAAEQSGIRDIRSYSMWTECRDLKTVSGNGEDGGQDVGRGRLPRPEQYESREIFGLVQSVLRDRGLQNARIGADIGLMKYGTYEWFRKSFPDRPLIDCETILYGARKIKHGEEIERLRRAASLFDVGVEYCTSRIHKGQTADSIRYDFEAGLSETMRQHPELGVCQKSFFFPHVGSGAGTPVRSGAIIKLDCGVKLDGYWSDACRHFCFGTPTADQHFVHNALHAGFEAALALIRPGVRMCEIYNTAIETVRHKGLHAYSRGHVGHSIGMDDQTEELPFIGPNNSVLEPGMVICLELPFYPPDVGGFNIEDMILVTETGHEVLTHLSRDLVSL